MLLWIMHQSGDDQSCNRGAFSLTDHRRVTDPSDTHEQHLISNIGATIELSHYLPLRSDLEVSKLE